MALQGDLASVDLSQVFQMLALNQKVGMLSIQSESAWKALYFDHRGVTLYYNEHTMLDRVLGTMVRTDQVLDAAVQEARAHAEQVGTELVDTLLAGGWLTEELVDATFRAEMEEEIYDLFFWRNARFEFFEGATSFEGREGIITDRYFFSTDSLIMEAARRIDEWQFIQERIPGPQEVYRRADADAGTELEDHALTVLELVDGKHNVARLVEVSGLAAFHVYKSLAVLLDEGMVQEMHPDELVPAAEECIAEERLPDAINLLEKAISLGVGIPEAHRDLARAYEQTDEYELATYHLKCIAEYRVSAEEVPGAVEILQRAIRLIPTDLEARERLVELSLGRTDLRDQTCNPVEEGKSLVDLYLEIGEIQRVRNILERLLRDNPDDLELKKILIKVHTKAGDTRRVIELYESIADDLVRQRNPIEAVRYLHKVLMIDRSRTDVSERIRTLYEMDERRRSRRRSMAVFAIILVLACLAAGGYWIYDKIARERLGNIDVAELLQNKQYEAAVAVYEAFIKSYPLTLAARDARGELARIESKRLAYEAEQRRLRDRHKQRLKALRTKYRMEWERYIAEFEGHNLRAALASLEKVKGLVAEAGERADLQWSAAKQVEKNLRELRDYIRGAEDLQRTAREYLRDGAWKRAREYLLELTEKYGMSPLAKRAKLPVMVKTRPAGARIFEGGAALTEERDGESVELRTPALVFCHHSRPQVVELRRDGFEPMKITIEPREAAEVERVLTIVPRVVAEVADVVQTPIGVGSRWLVAGLRGGRIAVVRHGARPAQATIELPGLREVEGTPQIATDRFLFRTNRDEIAAYSLETGRPLFRVEPERAPVHDPVVKDGRIFFGDAGNRLVCLDLSSGRRLWAEELGGAISARPTVNRRLVRVGTDAGEFRIHDASNGSLVARHETGAAVSTRILLATGFAVFGTADGRIVAMEEKDGKVLWAATLERAARPGAICLAEGHALVMDAGDVMAKIRLSDGRQVGTYRLPGKRLWGPVLAGDKVFLTVLESLPKGRSRSLLVGVELADLELLWEYRGGRSFRGYMSTDGKAVYSPGPGRQVLGFE